VIKKPHDRGCHILRWAAVPEKIMMIMMIIINWYNNQYEAIPGNLEGCTQLIQQQGPQYVAIEEGAVQGAKREGCAVVVRTWHTLWG
jgi:hypothetical protein